MNLKKKIVTGITTVSLAAALVGGATFAWFTSSDVNEDNVFTAGTLAITVSDTALFNETNIAPGFSDTASLTVDNTSSLPAKLKLTATSTPSTPTGKLPLADVVDIIITDTKGTAETTDDEELFNDTLTTLQANGVVLYDGTTAQLAAGTDVNLKFDASIDGENVGNDYQGSGVSNLDFTFTASQANNTGWDE